MAAFLPLQERAAPVTVEVTRTLTLAVHAVHPGRRVPRVMAVEALGGVAYPPKSPASSPPGLALPEPRQRTEQIAGVDEVVRAALPPPNVPDVAGAPVVAVAIDHVPRAADQVRPEVRCRPLLAVTVVV